MGVLMRADTDRIRRTALSLFFIDKMPVNMTVQGLYNVVKPWYQADWDIRLTVQLCFPEK
jgi:hypothetical protein